MNDLVSQTGSILENTTELMKIPAVSGAVVGLFGWLGIIFTKKSAKEKLYLIEQNLHGEETIIGLLANLETVLVDNEGLQNQLAEKLKELDLLMKQVGIIGTNTNKKVNIVNITGNANIAFQDILRSSNIAINR